MQKKVNVNYITVSAIFAVITLNFVSERPQQHEIYFECKYFISTQGNQSIDTHLATQSACAVSLLIHTINMVP